MTPFEQGYYRTMKVANIFSRAAGKLDDVGSKFMNRHVGPTPMGKKYQDWATGGGKTEFQNSLKDRAVQGHDGVSDFLQRNVGPTRGGQAYQDWAQGSGKGQLQGSILEAVHALRGQGLL